MIVVIDSGLGNQGSILNMLVKLGLEACRSRDAEVIAAAAGSLFVFYGKHRSVLINYPSSDELTRTLTPSPESGKDRSA